MAPEPLKSNFQKFISTRAFNLRPNTGRDPFMFDTCVEDHRRNTVINKMKINWNSLPLKIRTLDSNQIQKFKTDLKTFLFQQAYNC